jgi:hypothetical protein
VRRAALTLVVLPLVAVACGGGGGGKTTQSTASSRTADPGKAAVAALLHAAQTKDAKAIWELLSTPSQQRLGPTYAAFAARAAPQIEQALKPFEKADVTPFISQSVSQLFGIVAIREGAKALAFPLRNENGAWRVETPGPIAIQVLGPQPGSSGPVAQIGAEVRSPGVLGDAIVFVDGQALRPTLVPGKGNATVFANLKQALSPGAHIAVAYAEEGKNASALAWTFNATKPS